MFCEELQYNLLYRWFLDMDMVEPAFDPTTFTQNRERLLEHEVAGRFLAAITQDAQLRGLMSSEHFSVDGTLIQAWASHKSFRRKDDKDDDNNRWSSFKGEKRSNETHESKTDPEAKLMRKSHCEPAKLSYAAHVLMENRNGLIAEFEVSQADGFAERRVGLELLSRAPRGTNATLGADKGYDAKDFVAACIVLGAVPHVARNVQERRSSAAADELASTAGYEVSQVVRRRIEQIFGWMKGVGC